MTAIRFVKNSNNYSTSFGIDHTTLQVDHDQSGRLLSIEKRPSKQIRDGLGTQTLILSAVEAGRSS